MRTQPTRLTTGNDTTRDSNGVRDVATGETISALFLSPVRPPGVVRPLCRRCSAQANGVRDASLDFGFVNELVIGDYVWLDANANGLQDAGASRRCWRVVRSRSDGAQATRRSRASPLSFVCRCAQQTTHRSID